MRPATGRGALVRPPTEPGGRRMANRYDAIVVGARCAGSPTAMLLARKGYRVLVVDRASFPSDTLSTHCRSTPRASPRCSRWGLLDQVIASGCPPGRRATRSTSARSRSRARPGPAMASRPRTPRDGRCWTRSSSTPPSDAGAEVREGFTVEEVVIEERRRRRHPRPRRRRRTRGRAGPCRHRRRRPQLPCRQGRPASSSTTTSRCCKWATTRTGAASGGRLRDH